MVARLYAIGDTLYRLKGVTLIKAGKRNYREATEYTDDSGRKWLFNQQTRRWGLHPDSKKQKSAPKASKGKGTAVKQPAASGTQPLMTADNSYLTPRKGKGSKIQPTQQQTPARKKGSIPRAAQQFPKDKSKQKGSRAFEMQTTQKPKLSIPEGFEFMSLPGDDDRYFDKKKTQLVGIKRIEPQGKQTFPQQEIDAAAQSILDAGGLINPLIVVRDPSSNLMNTKYILANGNELARQASMRAYELDPKSETASTLILLDSDHAKSVETQLSLLDKYRPQGVNLQMPKAEVTQYGIGKGRGGISTVTTNKISLPESTSQTFPQQEIDAAAQSILDAGGLINPLIVVRDPSDPMSKYKLADGNEFAYQAALRARELDPFKGGNVNALVLENEEQARTVQQQLQTLSQSK